MTIWSKVHMIMFETNSSVEEEDGKFQTNYDPFFLSEISLSKFAISLKLCRNDSTWLPNSSFSL